MEKGLIVYYSLEGNTHYVAEILSENLGFDMLRIEPVEDIEKKGFKRFLSGGSQVIRKKEPELKKYSVDFENYSQLILASPVWAGSFVPAFRTFLGREKANIKNKSVSIIGCHDGGPGKIIDNFKNEIPENHFYKDLLLKKTLKDKEKNTEIIFNWIKEFKNEL